jgi:hypothetical protein
MLLRRVSLPAVAGTLFLSIALAGTALAGGRPFSGVMTGAEEAPGPGDPDGTGTFSFTFNQGLGQVCFELTVQNITLPATAAHIHIAPAGSPGPVVIGLVAPDASGMSSGCVDDVDPALIKAIRQNPDNYYVNVHTLPGFAAGAVRGQLGK